MKVINKILEKVSENTIVKIENKTFEVFSNNIIQLDEEEKINGKESFRQVMEYLSNRQYDELFNGSSFEYLKMVNALRKLNLTVYRTVAETTGEVAIRKLINQEKSKYAHVPELDREKTWFKEWYGSDEYLKFQNKYFDAILNGYAKRNMGFTGKATLIKDNKLQSIFPCDQIYICEQTKMIFLVDMVPVYGDKTINDIVYGDFENSPFFNFNIEHYSKNENEHYKRGLNKKASSVGYKEMNQESLLKYISKQKNEVNLKTWWQTCGRKYCASFQNLNQLILDIKDKELSKILETYVIYPIEYMYRPFVSDVSEVTHKFFWSQSGGSCIYDYDHTYKSTPEELIGRVEAVGYITDYLNIDKSNIYDYYSNQVIKERRDGRQT